jgi:hypothetical protein
MEKGGQLLVVRRVHHRRLLVGAHVLLEVVLAAEALAARGTRIGPQPRVDASVARQLLVACKRFAAAIVCARKWTLAYKNKNKHFLKTENTLNFMLYFI